MKTTIGCATLLLLLSVGCGGGKGSNNGEPVAECRQYEAALDACYHRDSGFAEQPAMIPKTDADRKRIAELCTVNLARIKVACH
jgi:hypothetical protein